MVQVLLPLQRWRAEFERLFQMIEALPVSEQEKTRLWEQTARAQAASRPLKGRSPADWRFRVLRWEMGQLLIFPPDAPQGKSVPNLRVFIHPDDPNEGAPYWDITTKRVQAMLLPILPKIAGTGAFLHIRKDGDGPTSRFSLTVEPS